MPVPILRVSPFTTSLLVLFLAACGGGDGSSNDSGHNANTPPIKPARATAEYSGTREDAAIDETLAKWFPELLAVATTLPVEYVTNGIYPVYENIIIDEIQEGDSGTVTATGQYTSNGSSDWFHFEFDAYRLGDVTYNGAFMQENQTFPYPAPSTVYPPAIFSFYNLELMAPGVHLRLNGTVKYTETSNSFLIVSNLVIEDILSEHVLYLENFAEETQDSELEHYLAPSTIKFTGRVYDSNEGGIAIATSSNFVFRSDYENPNWILHSGELTLSTDADTATLAFLNQHFMSLVLNTPTGLASFRYETDPFAAVPSFAKNYSAPLATILNRNGYYHIGENVPLDGRFSVSWTGKPLHYEWRIIPTPAGSHAILANENDPVAQFTTMESGSYIVQMTTGDGVSSDTDWQVVYISDDEWDGSTTLNDGYALQVIPASVDDNRIFLDARIAVGAYGYIDSEDLPNGYITFAPDIGRTDLSIDGLNILDMTGFRGALAEFVNSYSGISGASVEGAQSFSPAMPFYTGAAIQTSTVLQFDLRDINGDLIEDLIVLPDFSSGSYGVAKGLYIFMGEETGGHASPVYLAGDDSPGFVFGDLAAGGEDELVVVEGCAINIFENDGTGAFSLLRTITRNVCDDYITAQPPLVIDLDKDGSNTLILVEDTSTLRFVELDATGLETRNELLTFDYQVMPPEGVFGPHDAYIQQIDVMDADLDGKLDLVLSNSSASSDAGGFTLFLQQVDDATYVQDVSENRFGYDAANVQVSDVNGDGNADIVAGRYTKIHVWLASDTGLTHSAEYNPYPSGEPQIDADHLILVDIDGDGTDEIFAPADSLGIESMVMDIALDGSIESIFYPVIADSTNDTPKLSVSSMESDGWQGHARDINNDGALDLLVPDLGGIRVIFNTGD